MNYLSAENISKTYGDKTLFEGLSFGLHKGEKTALIANNGTGKSTLLKILAGKETPDTGKVTLREGIKIAFLDHDPYFAPGQTIDEIDENDFNLNIPRYVDTFEEEPEVDITAVQMEIETLEGELKTVQEEMKKYLKELEF